MPGFRRGLQFPGMTLSSFCLRVQPLALQGLFKRIRKKGSVEIPDLTLTPEIHDEPVFDGYRKGGLPQWRGRKEPKIFLNLLQFALSYVTATNPRNDMKNDDFYRAEKKSREEMRTM